MAEIDLVLTEVSLERWLKINREREPVHNFQSEQSRRVQDSLEESHVLRDRFTEIWCHRPW